MARGSKNRRRRGGSKRSAGREKAGRGKEVARKKGKIHPKADKARSTKKAASRAGRTGARAAAGMAAIKHIIVVMLENRSFDNMLGWLYWRENNRPPINIPYRSIPTYDGLTKEMWNPDRNEQKVFVTYGTTGSQPWLVPNPDPQELFDHMRYQIFRTSDPSPTATPKMNGFVIDYSTVPGADAKKIMECQSLEQVPVLSALARNYAVCDRWFGSVPCQTWPNRAFVHAGTSCGRVNNCNNNEDNCVPDPLYYNTRTIFNFLEDIGISWRVYNDSDLMSLTRAQFIEHLGDPFWENHFHGFGQFKKDAHEGHLPVYSFVEPSFLIEPNDEHPPHDTRAGEKFLYDIWEAVAGGKNWLNTLLVITYDEHGGCFDHAKPPHTATPPDNSPPQQPFDFRLYGPRVPAVVVSPWVEAGAVFRSPSANVEYDHTSILHTVWDRVDPQHKYQDKMLKSARIPRAPTLDMVLTRATPRTDLPLIPAPPVTAFEEPPDDFPLNSIQKAVIAATVAKQRGVDPGDAAVRGEVMERVKTRGDARKYLVKSL